MGCQSFHSTRSRGVRTAAACLVIVASSLCLLTAQSTAAQEEGEQVAQAEAQVKQEVAESPDSGSLSSLLGVGHLRFASAFLASISMIIVSEFGDKTFFIAAIMAMRNSRIEVFMSAIAALALMTVLSAVMGLTLPAMLDPSITHYMATALFFFFGLKLLYDATHMEGGDLKEEMAEVEEELASKNVDDGASGGDDSPGVGNIEMGGLLPGAASGLPRTQPSGIMATCRRMSAATSRFFSRFFSKVFIQCFSMTFLAEWGDRSQIATIALAAQKDAYGVTLGGIIGHALCTGVAVLGGKLLAARISERTISIVGGALFLVFGVHSVVFGLER